MPKMNVATLSEMCDRIDALGGDHDHPEIAARFLPIEPDFETVVDETLDPFSDAYYDRQIALYREISGRELDQATGELHAIDTSNLVGAPNPLALRDVRQLAEAVRLTATMLALAELPDAARVLDMGSGPGLGAEIQAYVGCRVHAVDIDAHLGDLARRRAAARGLDIVRSDLNYDDLGTIEDGAYDAAFFQASLHHSLKPWLLLGQVADKLGPDGVVAFAAEPIQTIWWKHWGLRLDLESLYVARARGWFESGWSHDFLRRCFARAGLRLAFFGSGGGRGRDIGVAAKTGERLHDLRAKAAALGLEEVAVPGRPDIVPADFASRCGERIGFLGRDGFVQRDGEDGALVYGPYATLAPGTYEAATIVRAGDPGLRGRLVFEVVADQGRRRFAATTRASWRARSSTLLLLRFSLPTETRGVECRVRLSHGGGWSASTPMVGRIGALS